MNEKTRHCSLLITFQCMKMKPISAERMMQQLMSSTGTVQSVMVLMSLWGLSDLEPGAS